MSSTPPQGSKIKVSYQKGHELITIPHSSGGAMRYFISLFLLFWLGGWFLGFTSALEQITSGKANAFIIFWLGGWTLGGVFTVYFLYILLRNPIPEKILLNRPNLDHDSGIPPFQFVFHLTNQKEFWEFFFLKRKKQTFSPDDLESLKLRETDSSNRLTIDSGSKRIEIGIGASEIEREWLYEYLHKSYS